MHDQPKYKPYSVSAFFPDGRSARPVPAGTVSYEEPENVEPFYTGYNGTDAANYVATIPVPINADLLHRGQERYDIFCSPCHDRLGTGHGMIERRGFKIPADLDSDRVRNAPPGYIFEVISNGYGAMPDHRDQIAVPDRWAIVAYIRALELSRHATIADVPAQNRKQLEAQ
jgi:mono/diheme cytochrome c family protein